MKKDRNRIAKVRARAITGFTFLAGREMAMKVIAVLGQLALVRILTPDIFGVFAIISFVIAGAALFTDFGLSMTIIQKKVTSKQDELSTIFHLKLLLTLIVVCIIFVFSPHLNLIYSHFGLLETSILRILSFTLIIQSVRSVMVSILERDLKYESISVIDLVGIFSYYLVALILAFLNFGIWSFVWAVVVKEIIETLISWNYCRWLPTNFFKLNIIKNQLKMGVFYQMGLITGFIYNSTIPIVAGILSTPYFVGLLDWSSNVSSIPRTLSENVGRVSFASFSRMQDSKDSIAQYISKSFIILSFFSLFFVVITISFGKELVSFLLTDKWLPALPALYWFIGSTFFLNGTALMGNVILALGKTKLMFYISIFFIFLQYILSVLFFRHIGFTGIAVANFLGTLVMFFVLLVLVRKLDIRVSFSRYILQGIIVFILSFTVAFILNQIIQTNSVLYLAFKLSIFTIIYIIMFKKILPDIVSQIKDVIKQQLKVNRPSLN